MLELVKTLQIDPVNFGMVVVINLSIGLATQPVGVCLFIACGIAKEPIEKVSIGMLPMIAITMFALLLATFVPEVSLFLPSLFFDLQISGA